MTIDDPKCHNQDLVQPNKYEKKKKKDCRVAGQEVGKTEPGARGTRGPELDLEEVDRISLSLFLCT